MKYELKIPGDLPPSMNSKQGGYKAHWSEVTKAKRNWEGLIFVALMQAGVPRHMESVKARAVLTVPTRIRRDEGNFRYMLEKVLGDVLVKQNYLPDDTPEHYQFPELQFDYKKGEKAVTIFLETA